MGGETEESAGEAHCVGRSHRKPWQRWDTRQNVVYELWRHGNVFTAFCGPRPRIKWLTRFTLLLRVGGSLREQEMLGRGLGVRPKTQRRTSVERARTARPSQNSVLVI